MTQTTPPFPYHVRAASPTDAETLAQMRLALQAHIARANPDLLALSPQRVATLAHFYRALLQDSTACVLVAESAAGEHGLGMALGRIVHHEEYEPVVWGHIDDVWVEPAHRGRGICRTLVGQLLQFFERGQTQVPVLDYVVGNREAERVGSRFGFYPMLTLANAQLHGVKARLKGSVA